MNHAQEYIHYRHSSDIETLLASGSYKSDIEDRYDMMSLLHLSRCKCIHLARESRGWC